MTHQFDCPTCRRKLYFPSPINSYEHLLEGICCQCRYKYALEQSEVTVFDSTVEALHNNVYSNIPATKYKRIYRARLVSANETVKSVEFCTPGQEEKMTALPGDELLLLYTMRGSKHKDLIWIKNQTTNQSHLLQRPGTKALSIGAAAGFLTLAVSTAIATVLHIPLGK